MELAPRAAALSDQLRRGPLDWRFAARVCAEVSAGLAGRARPGSIVHRDVKPRPTSSSPLWARKSLDFGIAAAAGEPDRIPIGNKHRRYRRLHRPRAAAWPPGHAPPTDMYSVGVLLYLRPSPASCRGSPRPTRTRRCSTRTGPWPLRRRCPRFDGLAQDAAQGLRRLPGQAAIRAPPPTAVAAALLLAAAVDAQVYLPPVFEPAQPGRVPRAHRGRPGRGDHQPPAPGSTTGFLTDRTDGQGATGPVSATIECVWSAATPSAPGGPGGPAGPGRGCTLPCESATTSAVPAATAAALPGM